MSASDVHVEVRQARPPAFADFMDEVFDKMSSAELESLPTDTWGYVNAMIRFGLEHIEEFEDSLKGAVAGVYRQSPHGERFLPDQIRTTAVVNATLFIDSEGALVSVRNPKLEWVDDEERPGSKVVTLGDYQSYDVLTGPQAGRRFDRFSRPLPDEPPLPQSLPLGGGTARSVLGSLPVSRSDGKPGATDVIYDVALSFAGEDRPYAEELAGALTREGYVVFYDRYEKADLWGKDLFQHLTDIYQNRARYCVIFMSKSYSQKLWTRQEQKAAQARAFAQSGEYVLPVRLDDVVLPGVLETSGYIDLRETPMPELCSLLMQKLRAP